MSMHWQALLLAKLKLLPADRVKDFNTILIYSKNVKAVSPQQHDSQCRSTLLSFRI